MVTVFETIETIDGEINFVYIIFVKRRHFTKIYQKNFVLLITPPPPPPYCFDDFKFTVFQPTF